MLHIIRESDASPNGSHLASCRIEGVAEGGVAGLSSDADGGHGDDEEEMEEMEEREKERDRGVGL